MRLHRIWETTSLRSNGWDDPNADELLRDGWEPYAATQYRLFLRRRKPLRRKKAA